MCLFRSTWKVYQLDKWYTEEQKVCLKEAPLSSYSSFARWELEKILQLSEMRMGIENSSHFPVSSFGRVSNYFINVLLILDMYFADSIHNEHKEIAITNSA